MKSPALAAEAPNVIAVHPSLGVDSLEGLVAAARAVRQELQV